MLIPNINTDADFDVDKNDENDETAEATDY